MKFELVKRDYKYLSIYIIIISLIIVFSIILFVRTINHGVIFGDFEVFLSISIAILLFSIFKIVPYLKLSKHKKIGYIHFSPDSIFIENKSSENKKIEINKINNLKIKLCGFDGQPRTGDVQTYFPAIWPVDGLNNIIKIPKEGFYSKYEFYISSIDNYNNLKDLMNSWKLLTNVDSHILR